MKLTQAERIYRDKKMSFQIKTTSVEYSSTKQTCRLAAFHKSVYITWRYLFLMSDRSLFMVLPLVFFT